MRYLTQGKYCMMDRNIQQIQFMVKEEFIFSIEAKISSILSDNKKLATLTGAFRNITKQYIRSSEIYYKHSIFQRWLKQLSIIRYKLRFSLRTVRLQSNLFLCRISPAKDNILALGKGNNNFPILGEISSITV